MIIDIIFQVPISLHSDRDNYNKSLVLTKKFEQYIDTNTIKSNSRLNSQSEIISDFGIISLLNTSINFLKILNQETMSVTLSVLLEKECQLTIENAENIIWSIFPSTYSMDDTYLFYFSHNYSNRSIRYQINMLDIPSNIQITSNNYR
jgi:hypothetical protein